MTRGGLQIFCWVNISFFMRINPLWCFRTLTDLLLIFSSRFLMRFVKTYLSIPILQYLHRLRMMLWSVTLSKMRSVRMKLLATQQPRNARNGQDRSASCLRRLWPSTRPWQGATRNHRALSSNKVWIQGGRFGFDNTFDYLFSSREQKNAMMRPRLLLGRGLRKNAP